MNAHFLAGRAARALALGWVLGVVVLSVIARARPDWLVSVAASPDRIARGKLWYLGTSAMLVDRPIVVSVVCFVVLAGLTLLVCGARTFWWSAVLGQVAATLLVYAVLDLVRGLVPAAFESVMGSPDYGVSTISAAWLGSIAATGWMHRGRSWRGRSMIAASCVAVGLFAYTVRPDVTFLSSEHPVAFGLGIAAAMPACAEWRRLLNRRRPARIAFAVLGPLLVAVAAAPVGVAALQEQIARRLHPTVTRCVLEWNALPTAPRLLARSAPPPVVSVAAFRRVVPRDFAGLAQPPRTVDYCRVTLAGARRTTTVLGRWRAGRIDTWTVTTTSGGVVSTRGDADVVRGGRLRLRHVGGRTLSLTS